jgi:hypothetical protein
MKANHIGQDTKKIRFYDADFLLKKRNDARKKVVDSANAKWLSGADKVPKQKNLSHQFIMFTGMKLNNNPGDSDDVNG